LEYWSDGIMGSGKLGQWFIGRTPKLLSKINIPIFHHSIIPIARQEIKPQKVPLISISRRISDIPN